jgi:hypothetical protein
MAQLAVKYLSSTSLKMAEKGRNMQHNYYILHVCILLCLIGQVWEHMLWTYKQLSSFFGWCLSFSLVNLHFFCRLTCIRTLKKYLNTQNGDMYPHSDIINNQQCVQVFYIRSSLIFCLTDQMGHIILAWFLFPLHCVICELALNDLNHRTYNKHIQGNEFPKFPFECLNSTDFVLYVLKRKRYSPLYLLGGKGGQCVRLRALPTSCADCLEILEASTSCSPKGLSRPITG